MRVMVIVKATNDSEAGVPPPAELLGAMRKFNEKLVKAGVLLSAAGLSASSHGVRVRFGDGQSTVIDGPFAETKELIGGFWLWQVSSIGEAIEWIRGSPLREGSAEIEIRPVLEGLECGADPTPELRTPRGAGRAQSAA